MVDTVKVSIAQFMAYYNVTLMNPKVLIGLFIGAVMAFYFCALTMKAVGRAAGAMVQEVRRQFSERPGIMKREEKPDYARCVAISTVGAQTGDDFSVADRYNRSGDCRFGLQRCRRSRFTCRWFGDWIRAGSDDGKRRRRMGQREEIH